MESGGGTTELDDTIKIGTTTYQKCTLLYNGNEIPTNVFEYARNELEIGPVNLGKLEDPRSNYVGNLVEEENGQYRSTAYLPETLFPKLSTIDESQYHIIDAIVSGLSNTGIVFAPEKIWLKVKGYRGEKKIKGLDDMYVSGKYRLSDALISLFSAGQELLHRVSLTQFNLTQEERDWISSVDLRSYVLEHKDDAKFLRMWSILITASTRSLSLFSMDPSKWVDPKIVSLQQRTSERTAAELNRYMLDQR